MPDFKIYYKALIKTVWHWHKSRHIDQWNRIENPEMDSQLYGQQIFDKAGNNSQWKKDSVFNKWCWENRKATCRRMIVDHPHTIPKKNSKCVKNLKVTQETIKILEENTVRKFFNLSHNKFLLDMSLVAKETKAQMNHWDFIKIKRFCTAKETVNITGNCTYGQGKIPTTVD